MEFANLGMLTLNLFDKNNPEAVKFLQKLCHDESIKKRFQGITGGLLKNENKDFFNHSFLVSHDDTFVGYINVGNYYEDEKCFFIRAAIDSDKRGMSYGKILVNEFSNFVWNNYPEVESIRIKIASDNIPSLRLADACGFIWIRDDFYAKLNPNLDLDIKNIKL